MSKKFSDSLLSETRAIDNHRTMSFDDDDAY